MDTTDFKPKSFWEKPEGTTGMIFALAGLFGGGYLLFIFLPTLIVLLQNTLYAIFLGIGLFAVLYVLLDRRFRTLIWFGYQSIMRFLTSIFITVDPIGIIENYVADLKKNLANMQTQIGILRGQMQNLKNIISKNQAQSDNSLKLAEQAKKKDDTNNLALQTRNSARLIDSNKTLQALYVRLEVLYRVLNKMSDNAEAVIQDTESEVDVRKREYEAIKTGTNALHSAMSIIDGNPDKKAIFDMTMEHLADDIGSQVGEMEHFMDMSKKITDSIDLQNGVFSEEGMRMLEDWEKKSGSVLLSDSDKKKLLAQANDPDDEVDLKDSGDKSKSSGKSKKGDSNPYDDMLK